MIKIKLAMCFDESACEMGYSDTSHCDECEKYKIARQQEVEIIREHECGNGIDTTPHCQNCGSRKNLVPGQLYCSECFNDLIRCARCGDIIDEHSLHHLCDECESILEAEFGDEHCSKCGFTAESCTCPEKRDELPDFLDGENFEGNTDF